MFAATDPRPELGAFYHDDFNISSDNGPLAGGSALERKVIDGIRNLNPFERLSVRFTRSVTGRDLFIDKLGVTGVRMTRIICDLCLFR